MLTLQHFSLTSMENVKGEKINKSFNQPPVLSCRELQGGWNLFQLAQSEEQGTAQTNSHELRLVMMAKLESKFNPTCLPSDCKWHMQTSSRYNQPHHRAAPRGKREAKFIRTMENTAEVRQIIINFYYCSVMLWCQSCSNLAIEKYIQKN